MGGWHAQMQQLAPYIDANGDEQVSQAEFTAFVRNFGGVDDSRETLQKAIQVTAAPNHRNFSPSFPAHCLRPLQRGSALLGVELHPSTRSQRTSQRGLAATYGVLLCTTQVGLVRIGEIHDDGQAGGGYARCHVFTQLSRRLWVVFPLLTAQEDGIKNDFLV